MDGETDISLLGREELPAPADGEGAGWEAQVGRVAAPVEVDIAIGADGGRLASRFAPEQLGTEPLPRQRCIIGRETGRKKHGHRKGEEEEAHTSIFSRRSLPAQTQGLVRVISM